MNVPQPKINNTVKVLRDMLQSSQPASQASNPSTKPIGPSGLPERVTNDDETVQGHYVNDGLMDPGVIDGVTATGGGAVIS